MHPETQLAIVAAFAGFLLKTSLGFCICWAISKVVVSPRRKFLVWFGFLIGAGCYWLWLIGSFVPHGSALIPLSVPAPLASASPVGKWQMQPSWAFPLSIGARVFGAMYLIVLGHFLFTRIKKQMRLRWVLRFAYKAPNTVENLLQRIAESFSTDRVRLLVLSGIYSPATFGWIHPVILLPPLCLEQDESELADIFRHELQHVRRRDFFFNSIAALCRALLFFHPAVWYAMRRLELESELACDLAVVRNSPERRATYAECLVRFARLHAAQEPTPWNLDFAGSSIQLKVRVRSVLTEARESPAWLLGLRAGLGVFLFAGFLCMAPSLFIVLSYASRIAQPVVPSMFHSRVTMRLRTRSAFRIRTRETARAAHVLAVPQLATAPAAQNETAVETAPSVPHESDTLLSGEPLPTLKQRSDAGEGTAPKPAQATTILLSSEPASRSGNPIFTKGRSVASAVITGAGEAARIAAEAHGREGH